jgi:hypothetical protein
VNCPKCKAEILSENLNIPTDVGKCTSCGNVFQISKSIIDTDSEFNINEIPKGAWYIQELNTTIIGATTRNWIAFFIVPFMIVWSGFALGGIYGSQIFTGKFNPLMSLFGIPFILGSIIFWSFACMTIWGKVELTFDKQGGRVFTGVGKIGRTKNFKWNEISRIGESMTNFHYPGSHAAQIVLEGRKRLFFGTGLNNERRYYILQALRKIHSQIRK